MLFPTPPLQLAPDVWLLKQFVATQELLPQIKAVAAQAVFRHYTVPGGKTMSVAMTSCGSLGWTSNKNGYAYLPHDPLTQRPWPAMPSTLMQLARDAASACGWRDFEPDSCLINRYEAGTSMGLHQDRDEKDMEAPIVSVSIGATAKFMIGGLRRSDPVKTIDLQDGDALVWGGAARLIFHGVRPLQETAGIRHNLTFRRAG